MYVVAAIVKTSIVNKNKSTILFPKMPHSNLKCRFKDMDKQPKQEEVLDYSERWDFIKTLPHRYIRDIAFVIASPNLLTNSKECNVTTIKFCSVKLPVASDSSLGGDKRSWVKSKNWLKTLDVQSVVKWFDARKKRTRLGDHFATSIEYVLRYSPFVQVKELLVSQQVMQEMKPCDEASYRQKELEFDCCVSEPLNVSENLEFTESQHSEDIINIPSSAQKKSSAVKGSIPKKKGKKIRFPIKTVGEFDFLFQISCPENYTTKFNLPAESSSEILNTGILKNSEQVLFLQPAFNADVEKEVHHWEVSVKFLLYAGPWEVFGIQTPEYATWKLVKHNKSLNGISNIELKEENICISTVSIDTSKCNCVHPINASVEHSDVNNTVRDTNMFFGCYLGPHEGETLFDRKTRLQNQLCLSENPLASSFLFKKFITEGSLEQAEEKECLTSVEKREQSLRVFPFAVLKGYLFYEYDLWCALVKDRERMCYRHLLSSSQCCEAKSKVNPKHWIGWWGRIDEFMKFASLPDFKESRWYVVPKQEWLSLVIVNGSVANGSAKVMELDELLTLAATVAEEAKSSKISRKRRFMVAEVKWDVSFMDPLDPPCNLENGTSSSLNCGAWVEASRGFIVEETWPNSMTYMPHGYVPDWSPSLQRLE